MCIYCEEKDGLECSNDCGTIVCYDCAKNSKLDKPICRECKIKEERRTIMDKNTIILKERVYIDGGAYDESVVKINKDTKRCIFGIINKMNDCFLHTAREETLTDGEICRIEAQLRAVTPSSVSELAQSHRVDVDPLNGDGSEDYSLSLLGEVSGITAEDISDVPTIPEKRETHTEYDRIADLSA